MYRFLVQMFEATVKYHDCARLQRELTALLPLFIIILCIFIDSVEPAMTK